MNRRRFLKLASATGVLLAARNARPAERSTSIDRPALVRRHNPLVTRIDPFSALSIGNGEFAFTADVTGLQTFLSPYAKDFPLCTVSHWGWHTAPLPAGLRSEDIQYTNYDAHGRPVPYLTNAKGQERLFNWLRENPHRLHLGRIGFDLKKSDGSPAAPEDIKGIEQALDQWTGLLTSRFEFEGKPVLVQTCVHPDLDLLSAHVESPLLANGQMQVLIAFPYGSPAVNMADWKCAERHETKLSQPAANRAEFHRQLDADEYRVVLTWSEGANLAETGKHEYRLRSTSPRQLEFVCHFSPKPLADPLPTFAQTRSASEAHWQRFWSEGGAVDLSGSTDPRAPELERRIVLSQFLTALHCAGSLPSQETGLLFNSWYGKFHLEMHWWHSVHFTAWNRFSLFEKSLGLYQRILPVAHEIAQRQGYAGVRWPKMIGPDGHDAPSPVGPLLAWQQPHPIYYAQLCYRNRPTRQTLEQWQQIVFETADFMASYAVLDKERGRYVLGPPMKTVSENNNALTTTNPSFELAYWRFGLRVAQQWRERLGLPRNPKWDEVLTKLSPLPVQDGVYLMQEGMTDTYTKMNWEHPALMGIYGVQPGDGVDPKIMRPTVRRVMETWQWERTWGWDFPMAAMAAARVGEPELAVQALSINATKNRYHPNGHNYQRPSLTAYLPGNGGLLSAVAMMAGGWDGGPETPAPGFPADGKWAARSENLKRWM
jgi:hypothetical protein